MSNTTILPSQESPNKERVRVWVAQLRSGKWVQGIGALHRLANDETPDTFCCLGVLCEVAIMNGLALHTAPATAQDGIPNAIVTYGPAGHYASSPWVLPPEVYQWAGFRSDTPRVQVTEDLIPGLLPDVEYDEERACLPLSALNDASVPFSVIADLIEKTYLPEDAK